jgi:hypothetical protein
VRRYSRRICGNSHFAVRLLALAAALVLGFAFGACSGGQAADKQQGQSATVDPYAEEKKNISTITVGPESGPLTAEDARWVEKFFQWLRPLVSAVDRVSAVRADIQSGQVGREEGATEVRTAMRRIDHCYADFAAMVGYPPSTRLDGTRDAAADACAHFDNGVDAARDLLAGRGGQEQVLALTWEEEWTRAAEYVALIERELSIYQPGGEKKLSRVTGKASTSRIEPEFSRVASALAGKLIEVRCWSDAEWSSLLDEVATFTGGEVGPDAFGFAQLGGHLVHLAADVCDGLVALRYERKRPTGGSPREAIAIGVAVLAHEAQHARGIANEATTECYGIQTIAGTARRLGASGAYARSLARSYWRDVYVRLSDEYRSERCRDGGTLDRRKKSTIWP